VNSSYITEIQEVQNSKEAASYAAVSGYVTAGVVSLAALVCLYKDGRSKPLCSTVFKQ